MHASSRQYRACETLEDFCRVCKTDRLHTVVAADADGRPIRVDCGYCHSEHNYRGGPRLRSSQDSATFGGHARSDRTAPPEGSRGSAGLSGSRSRSDREPFPIVSDRERTAPPMTADGTADIE